MWADFRRVHVPNLPCRTGGSTRISQPTRLRLRVPPMIQRAPLELSNFLTLSIASSEGELNTWAFQPLGFARFWACAIATDLKHGQFSVDPR